ncbi:hypothetical protein [Bacillus sp. CECT 9360]|uniref:hypothetical protein n=1 Tax=Bacillus sp. CECT 9360 TaxID=2845821 RepID=UPI001E57BD6B|nr:hypothetical protein [Bacillus sp. CECT 9360]CAH0344101.1 hypothetical protein BCI9360_00332 [Bacillus sp. CECT 9360]
MSDQDLRIEDFLASIAGLPYNTNLTKQQLLSKQFLIEQHGDLTMYFSPHNEYVNREARIVIVGITPGWTQMKTAFEQAVRSMRRGKSPETLFKEAKTAASFSGAMRTHLISMLTECGVARALQLENAEALFHEKRDLLHTTSIIKYPVFYHHKNYTGHQPKVDQSSLLRHYAYEVFPKEIEELHHSPLIIPLGKSVEQVIRTLIDDRKLSGLTCLFGFPHPSGANGHRKKQFSNQLGSMKSIIDKCAQTVSLP